MSIKLMAALALAACVAAAADSGAPRLVTLNFSAADAQGHAITDLTAAEIQVTDQGKSAPVAAFRNDALRSAPGPREFSNRPAPSVAHIQVILFDLLNLNLASRQPAIDQIVRALEKQENSDSIYFYLINQLGELTPVRALPDAPPDPRPAATPWTRNIRAMLEQAAGPVAAVQGAVQRDVMLRVQKSYAALEILGGRMAPLPGRKNILWITFGVPCSVPTENSQIWDCRPTLGKVAVKLDGANVAVSPIQLQSGTADIESGVTMQQFVDLTGGKLFGADIERAIADSADLEKSSYRLQYAPAANNWDGKMHKVRLTSTRKGVVLLSAQSYTAEKAAPSEKDRNAALFQSPFDVANIALSVSAGPGPQPHTLHLRIGIDIQDLLLIPQADRFAGQLVFTVAAFLPDNRLQNYAPLPVNLNLTTEQRDKMIRDGMHLGHDVTLPEGVKKVRLLVEDRLANTAATVTIPVE
jgi:VWFA-related protein